MVKVNPHLWKSSTFCGRFRVFYETQSSRILNHKCFRNTSPCTPYFHISHVIFSGSAGQHAVSLIRMHCILNCTYDLKLKYSTSCALPVFVLSISVAGELTCHTAQARMDALTQLFSNACLLAHGVQITRIHLLSLFS